MLFYDNMKAKQQKNFNEAVHWFNLFNVLQAMFRWNGLPDTIPQEQLEGILISNGTIGIGEIKGDYWAGFGSYCGDVKGFLPLKYQFTVNGVGSIEGDWKKDIVVGWNNATFTPDLILMQYASILTEVDVSEKANVLFSRYIRIPKVKDQKEKTAIEGAIKAIQNGKVEAVISDNIHDIKELIGSGYSRDDNFLDLVDVKEIDKLQYLNQYRDNVLKRFFQIYGISTQVTAKMAQQNNAEIHANDDVAMTLFMQRYRYRQKLSEELNKRFGWHTSVTIEEGWQDSVDSILHEDKGEEGEPDENINSEESNDSD